MKSAAQAYDDMMSNLAKSTAAIPLHLQGAKGALAWWESQDSLLAKASIAETDLLKSSHEDEEEEEGTEGSEDAREESNAENDVHGGDAPIGDDDTVEKALASLDSIASGMLGVSQGVLTKGMSSPVTDPALTELESAIAPLE